MKVTQSIFNAVKTLIKGGASNKECAEYMQLSLTAVSMIRNSENLDEYRANMIYISDNARQKRKKATEAKPEEKPEPPKDDVPHVVEHRQNVTIQATHYMEQELRKTNELLTSISNKLAFIVEELTGTRSEEKVEGA